MFKAEVETAKDVEELKKKLAAKEASRAKRQSADGPQGRPGKSRQPNDMAAGIESAETSTIFYLHAMSMFGGRILGGMINAYNSLFGLSAKDKATIHRNVSNHYIRKGMHPKAINSLKEWARLEPKNTEALYQLALALSADGKTKPAITVLDKLLKIDPKHIDAIYRKCRLQLKRKEFAEAIEGLEVLRESDSGNPEIYYLLGMTYSRLEKEAEAIAAMEKAVELNDEESKYFQHLGFLYERVGESEGAARCFSRVMELEDDEGEEDFDF